MLTKLIQVRILDSNDESVGELLVCHEVCHEDSDYNWILVCPLHREQYHLSDFPGGSISVLMDSLLSGFEHRCWTLTVGISIATPPLPGRVNGQIP